MDDLFRKAETLVEAAPYLRRHRGTLTVVKLGGSAMEDPASLAATLQDVNFLAAAGIRVVLVHGGGKPIDRAMADAGLVPRKVAGRRYTDPDTLAIVARVLIELNEGIVAKMRDDGGHAVALHTSPLNALFGERLTLPSDDGGRIDLGRVGTVTRVDVGMVRSFADAGVVPVIPSLATDAEGRLNINADTAASAVAAALGAEKVVFLSDIPGVLMDRHDPSSLLANLDEADCLRLIREGVIDAGMIPKVEACLDALRAGVKKTHMTDGRVPHALLREVFTGKAVGTEIVLTHPATTQGSNP